VPPVLNLPRATDQAVGQSFHIRNTENISPEPTAATRTAAG
jgi:hypothetical protein